MNYISHKFDVGKRAWVREEFPETGRMALNGPYTVTGVHAEKVLGEWEISYTLADREHDLPEDRLCEHGYSSLGRAASDMYTKIEEWEEAAKQLTPPVEGAES
jgi:ribulose-5-phosphate 4-epimerase/fuculose-1-phosphate aldolase